MRKIQDGYDIAEAFSAIEDELIASMIRNMKRHKVEEVQEEKEWAMWQAEQLKALGKYRAQNRKRFKNDFRDINGKITSLIRQANQEGGMDQEREILQAIQKGFKTHGRNHSGPPGTAAEFFRLNEGKLEALIQATAHDMQQAETAILRRANDQYRKVIFNAQVYANSGAGTYAKAVDMATHDMLAAGLSCIEYKNGARHTLKDYADMAIRTASKRAYLQGEGAKRQEWGISTVIMNKRGNPCPKCLPFVGKVMVDDVWSGGPKDGVSPETGVKYPLISNAIEAGLYHPRCRDSHSTYFEGISTPPDGKYTKEELDELVEQKRLEERGQHARLQEEKYGRMAKYSLDPGNQEMYRRRAEEWGAERRQCQEKGDWGKKILSLVSGQNVEKQAKKFYHSLIHVEDDDIYGLLQQSYQRVKFGRSNERRSFFNGRERCVYLAKNTEYSTVAHELFHEIDSTYGITENGALRMETLSDYKRMKEMGMEAGKTIPEVLYSKHPEMFEEGHGRLVMRREYRGVADIINGMSGGEIKMGYRHADGYWKKKDALQKEAWAQYGRMYYSGDKEVLGVLKDIFPETTREFERIVRGMVK